MLGKAAKRGGDAIAFGGPSAIGSIGHLPRFIPAGQPPHASVRTCPSARSPAKQVGSPTQLYVRRRRPTLERLLLSRIPLHDQHGDEGPNRFRGGPLEASSVIELTVGPHFDVSQHVTCTVAGVWIPPIHLAHRSCTGVARRHDEQTAK